MTEDVFTLKPGSSIRFKTCGFLDYECLHCPKHECRKRGNYDLDGYRYEKIHAVQFPIGIVTETSIRVLTEHIDAYTYNPDNTLELPL